MLPLWLKEPSQLLSSNKKIEGEFMISTEVLKLLENSGMELLLVL